MLSLTKTSNLIKLCAFISVIVYIGQMLKLGSVVSLCFAISLVCVLAFYWLQVMRHQRVKVSDLLMVATMALAIVYAGIQTDFDYYKPAIIVLCTVICVDICPHNELDEKEIDAIINLLVLAAIVTNLLYYIGDLRFHYFGTTTLIALNFNNPNEAAMWLTCIFILLMNGLSSVKGRFKKFFLAVCGLSLIPILQATGARACIIAVAFFFVMKLIAWALHISSLPRWVVFVVTLSPAFVYVLYMYVFTPYYDFFSEWFSFFVATGKSLTSRVEVWGILEDDLLECVLLGKYDFYHTEQMHNALGTLYGRFGLLFVFVTCRKFYKAVRNVSTINGQIALCAAWIIGCFETAFFTGAAGLYLMILLLPLIAGKPNNKSLK